MLSVLVRSITFDVRQVLPRLSPLRNNFTFTDTMSSHALLSTRSVIVYASGVFVHDLVIFPFFCYNWRTTGSLSP